MLEILFPGNQRRTVHACNYYILYLSCALASGSSGKMAYVYQDGRGGLESICSVLWTLYHVF